ncbi:GDSL family lipase [Calothrix sp. NIES-4071]|nr:GDSL family lipase [Calothrix sp. NIES-4071]BAZ60053.1 GDSL family lipase [Calothrix sp. NIES-4105]
MNKKIAATGLILFSFILPSKASAASFSKFFIFGDSLSDAGNAYNGTLKQIPASPPYFEGRFSNGDIWTDYLGEQLNLEPALLTSLATTSPSQGINFAIGGSKSGQGNSFVPFLPLPGVLEQVQLLTSPLQKLNTKLDSNALYAIWGGGNDYLSGVTDTNQTVNNLTSAVGLLTQAGAKNVMVLNLPDLGRTPQALNTGTNANLTALTEKHNTTLKSALLPFSSNPELNIIPVDVKNLSDEIFANPQAFGVNNVTQACLNTNLSVCNNPSGFLFFDNIHPTTKFHNLLATEALSAINSKSIPIAASVAIASTSTSIPEPSTNWAIIGAATLVSIGCLKRAKQSSCCPQYQKR